MRIGVDIDGVLTDVERFSIDYFSKYLVENNIKYNVGNASYYIAETFNVTEEIENSFWEKYLEFYAKSEKVRPFASEVINKLKNDGHEIYIVTARWLTDKDDEIGKNMRNIVKKWLLDNNIVYDKLVFSRSKNEEKSQEVMEYEIDIIIEDSPRNINRLSKFTTIICFDTNYNKHCEGINIHRCYSWYDIYNKINELSKEIN